MTRNLTLLTLPAVAVTFALAGFAFAAGETGTDHSTHTHSHDQAESHDPAESMMKMAARMPDHIGMDEGNSIEGAMRPDGFQYQRSFNPYVMPDVTLRNARGKKVDFPELMQFDGPIVLNFIFTSCATICPVMSATFAQTQEDIAKIDEHYLMVSISIDPEYDTPSRLRDYAKMHDAGDGWMFLTGQFDDIFQVVRAFDAIYKGDNKMYHRPLTFMRDGADADWLRIEGLLSSAELADEFASLVQGAAD